MSDNEHVGPDEPAEVETDEGARAFSAFLASLGYGDAHQELSEELQKLIDTMQTEAYNRSTAVTGGLTLAIKFKVDDRGVCAAAYEIKAKVPSKQTSESLFWVTKGGNLTAENPRQQKLALKDVGGREGGPVRDANSNKPEVRGV